MKVKASESFANGGTIDVSQCPSMLHTAPTKKMSARNESSDLKYDGVFMQIAGQIGSIQGLLDNFFGFMHRKTDFYVQYADTTHEASMGFPIGAAERMVLKCFRKYEMKDYASQLNVPINKTATSISVDMIEPSNLTNSPAAKGYNNTVDALSKCLQIPVGNGGVADNYYWTQTLNEVTVYVDAPSACRGKDVKCNLTRKTIHLAASGKTLLEGEFEEGIRVDESMWTLNVGMSQSLFSIRTIIILDSYASYLLLKFSSFQDNRSDALIERSEIVITIEKIMKTWWKHVIIGHPEIDVTKVKVKISIPLSILLFCRIFVFFNLFLTFFHDC